VKQINCDAVYDNNVVVGKKISTSNVVTITVFAGTSSPEDMCHLPFLKNFRYLICNVVSFSYMFIIVAVEEHRTIRTKSTTSCINVQPIKTQGQFIELETLSAVSSKVSFATFLCTETN